jgi:hypothetical protein
LSESSQRQSLATSGRWNPASAGIRPLIWPDLDKMVRIWPDLEESGQDPVGSDLIRNILSIIQQGDWTLLDSGGSYIFAFVLFFRASQTLENIFEKIIFLENDFIENILQRKPFYVETSRV